MNGEDIDRYRVEWWYPDKVEYWEQKDKDDKFILKETKGHFEKYNSTKPETKEKGSWGRIPFILLKNNTEQFTDLRHIKTLVDAYDKGESIIVNNLEDIQEALVKAVGVSEDPGELRDNLRKFKTVVSSDADGDIDTLTTEIPFEARDRTSKNLEENIFTFGMGINPKTDKFGNDPTGVALRWMYMPLDLKAGMLERKMILALYEFFWFVCEYARITQEKDWDSKELEFTFNKSMIANESEQIENVVKSKGVIPEEIALANHPWIDDPQEALKLLEAEQKKAYEEQKLFLGNVEDEDEEE